MAAAYRAKGGGSRKARGDAIQTLKKKGSGQRQRGRLPFHSDAGDAVMVNSYSERWLRRGFCWVYSDEVIGRTGELVPGRVVSIVSREGADLGTGVWDSGRIQVRRMREARGPIDSDFIAERVRAARARRRTSPATTAWRWIHGENDDMPGIRVDVWGEHLTILLDSGALDGLLDPLVDALVDQHSVRSICVAKRPVHGDEDPEINKAGIIWGVAPDGPVDVRELGLRFGVEPARGIDAGLFCDMRAMRQWLQPHWKGRRVLNTFAYTGAFSVAAAAHGAREVVSVDLSAKHMDRAKDNFTRNHLDLEAHAFLVEDTMKALDRFRRKGEQFDLVVADPPSFAHGPDGDWQVGKGLQRLVTGCLRVLAPGGWLVVASNLGTMSPKDFQKKVQNGAVRAERRVRLMHQGSPPHDFPAALHFPESRYLKAWVVEA
jgi:23S rRNA (cytosine1962-C5)-methyltransferase